MPNLHQKKPALAQVIYDFNIYCCSLVVPILHLFTSKNITIYL
jgi:hypothetical protein